MRERVLSQYRCHKIEIHSLKNSLVRHYAEIVSLSFKDLNLRCIYEKVSGQFKKITFEVIGDYRRVFLQPRYVSATQNRKST